ncbi:MAG: DUF928 domain-containing protein [Phormidesmis sp.]
MKPQNAPWIISSLCLLGLSSSMHVARAQSTVTSQTPAQTTLEPGSLHSYSKIPNSTIQFNPPPLPDRGRPEGRRRGGASRGECALSEHLPLTALIPSRASADLSPSAEPAENSTVTTVFSLTAQARPSFWYYVPYSLSTTRLEFVLQDEDNNTVYQSAVSPSQSDHPESGGIIQVSLPDTAPALQPNGLYHWFFLAYCDQTSPEFVDGWILRSPMSEAISLAANNAVPRAQAAIYAQNSLWQEALTLLGENYREFPTDPTRASDWENLLEAAGLRELSEESLVDCCAFEH